MADLRTTYMGLELDSPIVVGACSLSKHVERIQEAADNGAAALVIKSLFEEQIELERQELEDALQVGADYQQEAQSFLPDLDHAGPEQHLFWIEKTRKAVKIPLIASLNAGNAGTWLDWAKRLEETGVDGIELNVFTLGNQPDRSAADIEKGVVEIVETVCDKVRVPVSVKLSPQFTALSHLVGRLDQLGVGALVLFNRFFHPDIDVRTEKVVQRLRYSTREEALLPLRWIGLLHGQVKADLVASTGVHEADDVVKMLLAGAKAVQVASALYLNRVEHVAKLRDGLAAWMDEKGYKTIDAFRAKLSQNTLPDPYAYERAQYIKLLLGFD